MITQEELKRVLDYDPDTGIFRWKIVHPNATKIRKDRIAGCQMCNGYIGISIAQKQYYAHRLAWLYVYGEWPPSRIDHKDGHSDHNWIDNLRLASPSQNAANARQSIKSTSGYKGVTFHRGAKKWAAAVTHNNKAHHLGLFSTPEEAHAAYVNAARAVFGDFARAR